MLLSLDIEAFAVYPKSAPGAERARAALSERAVVLLIWPASAQCRAGAALSEHT